MKTTHLLLALALPMLAAPAVATAQDDPAAAGACRVRVGQALDALEGLDEHLVDSGQRIERAQTLVAWMGRAADVDELSLQDRLAQLNATRISVNRVRDIETDANERGVPAGLAGAAMPDLLALLGLGIPTLGAAGAGVFRGASGRWPFQSPDAAAAKHADVAARLASQSKKRQGAYSKAKSAADHLAEMLDARTSNDGHFLPPMPGNGDRQN